MEQLKGLYFISIEDPYAYDRYDDVPGLYVSTKPITPHTFREFEDAEKIVRAEMRNNIVTADSRHWAEEYRKQVVAYNDWYQDRGTVEELFVKEHNLVRVQHVQFTLR